MFHLFIKNSVFIEALKKSSINLESGYFLTEFFQTRAKYLTPYSLLSQQSQKTYMYFFKPKLADNYKYHLLFLISFPISMNFFPNFLCMVLK